MRKLLVGLTGGLASGKSTVGQLLAERGFKVVDADELVAELYLPGGDGARIIVDEFGAGMLTAEGAVDHAALAARIFSEPEARLRVEELVHPLVRERFLGIAQRAPEPFVVLEAPLLVEAGYVESFDVVVNVESDPETRIRRAVERGLDEEAARRRLAAQGDGSRRRAATDITIHNDGSLDDLERLVAELADELGRIRSGSRALDSR